MALKLAKHAVNNTPSEFLTWAKLTEGLYHPNHGRSCNDWVAQTKFLPLLLLHSLYRFGGLSECT